MLGSCTSAGSSAVRALICGEGISEAGWCRYYGFLWPSDGVKQARLWENNRGRENSTRLCRGGLSTEPEGDGTNEEKFLKKKSKTSEYLCWYVFLMALLLKTVLKTVFCGFVSELLSGGYPVLLLMQVSAMDLASGWDFCILQVL
ncbi:UNVERIFIED_CONTAM: hypothetical protein K2H54_044987 [Gekko kuhli]